MLRLQKSSFPARRKQATRKATRCCLSTGGGRGRGRKDRAHRPLPLQNRPGASLQTKLHTGPRECGRRNVPVRTPSQAGTRRATLKGRKPAGSGQAQAPGQRRPRAQTGNREVAPQEEGPNQEPSGSRADQDRSQRRHSQAMCTRGSGQQSLVSPHPRGWWGPSLRACGCRDGRGDCHSAQQL